MATSASNIRNVAFIGINGSGKTSLVESILSVTGATSRRGKIQDGTMTTDYEPESTSRQMSTQVSAAHAKHQNMQINILDCPGFIDFSEEVKLALMGVDTAVFVVEPDPDRLIQIDSLLRFTEDIGIARMVFVNKLDKVDQPVAATLDALKQMPGSKVPFPLATMQYPIGSGESFSGFVSVLKKEGFKYGDKGKPEPCDVPEELQADLESAREKLVETLADSDDELIEMVLEGKEPPIEHLEKDLQSALRSGSFVPVLVGSANEDKGTIALLDLICSICPSPADREYKDKDGKEVAVKEDGPVIAQVIKTYVHPQSGKISLCRVFSGTLKSDSQLVVAGSDNKPERIGGLYTIQGKNQEAVDSAEPGSIIGISRMEAPHTGNTVVTDNAKTTMPIPEEPAPLYSIAISAENRNDETKLGPLLHKIIEEDPILKSQRDPDTNEFCLYGQGEVHLTLNRQRLERKYGLKLNSKRPQIAYKETIQKKVEAHGRHKKQSGGRGQFGEVYFKVEPLERGSGNKFSESVVGGSVPKNFHPGVEKGFHEACEKGPLAGFPLVDISVNLFDGSFHDVDSDEMSFKMAAKLAMKDGLGKAGPIILEPVAEVKIIVPNNYTSAILGQISGRRGQILGYGPLEGRQGWDEVNCNMPQKELWDYIIELRTATQGLGYYKWKFSHLQPVPAQLAQELQAAATAAAEA